MPARLWRSTGPVDRIPESVDRRAQTCARWLGTGLGRPVGRPARELCSLENFGRPDGRPTCTGLCTFGQSIGPVDRARLWRSTVRSTANGQKIDRWSPTVDRPVNREKIESRALWFGRPPGRPAQVPAQRAQICARRSTDSGSGRSVGRPPEPVRHCSGSENRVKKYSNKSHKSSKNSQK